jgi:hypothetical protein
MAEFRLAAACNEPRKEPCARTSVYSGSLGPLEFLLVPVENSHLRNHSVRNLPVDETLPLGQIGQIQSIVLCHFHVPVPCFGQSILAFSSSLGVFRLKNVKSSVSRG